VEYGLVVGVIAVGALVLALVLTGRFAAFFERGSASC
jgi:Flp pilus assembly pilin Flp